MKKKTRLIIEKKPMYIIYGQKQVSILYKILSYVYNNYYYY